MTLQVFVPKATRAYFGLRVPEKVFSTDGKDLGRLLAGFEWTIVEGGPAEAHISIEQPWGTSRAFAGDYILRSEFGTLSVLAPLQYYALSLKGIDIPLTSV